MTTEPGTPATSRGLVRNALHLGIGQVLTTALTILASAAVARTLGASEFGLLYLVTSIATFAYVFVDWGHGPYVTREIARHPNRSGELMGSVLVVRAGTALIMCALAVVFTWLLGYDGRTRLFGAVLILAWLPQYLGLTYSWVFRGHERMEYDAFIQVVLKFSTVLVVLACLALGGRVLGLILTSTVAGFITFAAAVVSYQRLGYPPLHYSKITARELIRDGAPMLAIALAVAVQPYIDANLLFKFVPPEVLGWYGAAWAVAGTLVAPATILGATMYPRLSRVSADPTEFTRTLRIGLRALLFVATLGAAGTYLFANVAIGLIYSRRQFGPAADILRAFTPALVLTYVDMILAYAIVAIGKAGQLAKAKVVAVVITTAVELMLVPYFQSRFSNGGMGIVLALACGEVVMVAAAIILLRDAVDRGTLIDFVRALVSCFATIFLIRSFPLDSPFIAIPLCVAAFAAVAWAVGLVKPSDVDALLPGFRRSQKSPN